jgi:cysteine desulfuration protein SufE
MPLPDPLDDLRTLPDAAERLMWVVERGRRVPPLAIAERVETHRVPGCVSAVWIVDESCDGICRFRGDAEAPVLRGLVALICERVTGRSASIVAADATDVVVALELERHLTPTRTQGLRALQQHLRQRAAAHVTASTP